MICPREQLQVQGKRLWAMGRGPWRCWHRRCNVSEGAAAGAGEAALGNGKGALEVLASSMQCVRGSSRRCRGSGFGQWEGGLRGVGVFNTGGTDKGADLKNKSVVRPRSDLLHDPASRVDPGMVKPMEISPEDLSMVTLMKPCRLVARPEDWKSLVLHVVVVEDGVDVEDVLLDGVVVIEVGDGVIVVDEDGHMLVDILKEKGVSTYGVLFDMGGRTALAFVTLYSDGEHEFMFYRNPNVDMLLKDSELKLQCATTVALDSVEESISDILECQHPLPKTTDPAVQISSNFTPVNEHPGEHNFPILRRIPFTSAESTSAKMPISYLRRPPTTTSLTGMALCTESLALSSYISSPLSSTRAGFVGLVPWQLGNLTNLNQLNLGSEIHHLGRSLH
ncbi:hypothetical protein ACLOJK_012651 [Asimina triloba]